MNKAAQQLGKLGGRARARALSAERRKEIARIANKASQLARLIAKQKQCQSEQEQQDSQDMHSKIVEEIS